MDKTLIDENLNALEEQDKRRLDPFREQRIASEVNILRLKAKKLTEEKGE